jgi:multiple antibiotic resistance protein
LAHTMPDVPLPKLFALLFMMTGPLRVVPAFAGLTAKLDAPTRHRLALRGALFAAAGVLLAVFVGAGILKSWGASREALATVTGLLLLLTALQSVIGWPAPPTPTLAPEGENLPLSRLALAPLAFPNILPPCAVGVLMLFAAFFPDPREPTQNGRIGSGIVSGRPHCHEIRPSDLEGHRHRDIASARSGVRRAPTVAGSRNDLLGPEDGLRFGLNRPI